MLEVISGIGKSTLARLDHGDAYGDDGFHGRGIALPAVFTVLYAAWMHG